MTPKYSVSLFLLLSIVLGTVLIGCRGLSSEGLPPQPILPLKPVTNRVILVVVENQKFDAIVGSPRAPYLNSLANKYSVATNYFANTHPSIGDYFMMTVGQIISNDLFFSGTVRDNNIVRLLGQNSLGWKTYAESMPSVGYTADQAYPYVKTHNPMAYFSDIVLLDSQRNNMVPLTQFDADLASDSLPSFVYIVPDQTHNMHDCPGGGRACTNIDKVMAGDAWMQQHLDPIINDPSFDQHNTLLIVTSDESFDTDFANGGGHIFAIIVGPSIKNGFQSTTFYQHQSLLRLMCEHLGIPNVLGQAVNAPSMQEFFK